MSSQSTNQDLSQSPFATSMARPTCSGVKFDKPRNKDWILNPQKKRSMWRRHVSRAFWTLVIITALPVGLLHAGLLPDLGTLLVCAASNAAGMPSVIGTCQVAAEQMAFIN